MAENKDADRAEEKEASRAADEVLRAGGTPEQAIEAKNAFLLASRTIVHWARSKPL